tara:strand:- start:751 stop:894 length:144 start_codon:yes stop_codon:yes gene_type:complete
MGLEPPTTCDKLELALKTGKNENIANSITYTNNTLSPFIILFRFIYL